MGMRMRNRSARTTMSTKTIQRKRDVEIERRDERDERDDFTARPSHPWLTCLDCGKLQYVESVEDEAEIENSPLICSKCRGARFVWSKTPCALCLNEQEFTAPPGTSHRM